MASDGFYLDRIAQQNVRIDLGKLPVVGGVANRRQNVARVRVAPGNAMGWRVVLAPLVFAEPFPGAIIDFTSGVPNKPRAIVTYGTDGVNQQAVVDWPAGGAMFSVWGDTVTIDGEIPATWVTGALPASVALAAAVTPDASGGGMRATFSQYTDLIAGGAFSGGLPIPANARSFRWHQSINTLATGAPIPIAWFTTMDSGLAVPTQSTPYGVYTSSETTWPSDDGITLPPDARFVLFENRQTVPPAFLSMTVEYCLDLG